MENWRSSTATLDASNRLRDFIQALRLFSEHLHRVGADFMMMVHKQALHTSEDIASIQIIVSSRIWDTSLHWDCDADGFRGGFFSCGTENFQQLIPFRSQVLSSRNN